ncbi:MAG TPA: hypothetical protein PLL66_07930 [Bacteroidales bacterium]|nr:hypothetical protein [Bacteroidales bacterium]
MHRIFIFIGIILIGSGLLVYSVDIQIKGNTSLDEETVKLLMLGILGGLGLLFSIFGIVGAIIGRGKIKKQKHILNNGMETEATVDFVDKNFSILVQQKPIFSIVEYSYTDQNGNSHTRRVTNVNSDLVIRKQIQVGSKIKIKYIPDNPGDSVMLL